MGQGLAQEGEQENEEEGFETTKYTKHTKRQELGIGRSFSLKKHCLFRERIDPNALQTMGLGYHSATVASAAASCYCGAFRSRREVTGPMANA